MWSLRACVLMLGAVPCVFEGLVMRLSGVGVEDGAGACDAVDKIGGRVA
jgi:hypothetical protein